MVGMNMSIRWETRICEVNGHTGYFHTWEFYSKPLEASPMIGGAPAGVFSKIFGIVELADGVHRVDPTEIKFTDEQHSVLTGFDKFKEDAEKRIAKGPLPDDYRNDIISILTHADAVTCTVTGYEPMPYASKALYEIPSSHRVTIDYNKMAKALYDAGYRKAEAK